MPTNALAPEPRNAMLRPYDPTLRERIAAYFMGDTRPSPERRQFATGIADILSYLPGTGNIIQGEEAFRRGDNKGAILAALPIPGAANVAARAEQEAVKRGIRAFHGSPYHFEKFDISKIGAGEGNQAFGPGLYFAEKENIAKSYRDSLQKVRNEDLKEYFKPGNIVPSYFGQDKVIDFKQDAEGGFRVLVQEVDRNGNIVGPPREHFTRPGVDQFRQVTGRNPGAMYEVNINAQPSEFLDWDKSLSQQTPEVKSALQAYYGPAFDTMLEQNLSGADIAKRMKTPEEMAQTKLPGIKYLDASSRKTSEGTYNYVVNDDRLVEIMRKYGLMGPIGAGIAAKILERQEQRQEM